MKTARPMIFILLAVTLLGAAAPAGKKGQGDKKPGNQSPSSRRSSGSDEVRIVEEIPAEVVEVARVTPRSRSSVSKIQYEMDHANCRYHTRAFTEWI